MTFKRLLKISTSLMLVCTSFISSFAQAEEYITKSQINVVNGVAGLNGNKEVTANTFNNSVKTDYLQLNKYNDRLRFITNSPDTNNNMIDMFYNRDGGNKDDLGNPLDYNTFYFTNNKWGNKYKFNGDVAVNAMLVNGHSIIDPIPGGYEPIDPYNKSKDASLIFLSKAGYDWGNMKPNTLMIGGRTRNAVVNIKATCQNTGQGDQGGSCYQFTDMSGQQAVHRGGAGFTDGINMDMRTSDNSPMDSVGGNQLVKNDDDSYTVKGNIYTPVGSVNAGESKFTVKGAVACGIYDGRSRCELSGASFLNDKGQTVTSVKIMPGRYNSSRDETEITIADGYKLQSPLTAENILNILFYSSDGAAYGVGFGEEKDGAQYAFIYPALSQEERNLTHARMAVWSNIANGMTDAEPGTNEDASNVDMPNYYYGYLDGLVDSVLNQSNIDAIGKDTNKTDDEKNIAIRQNKITKLYVRSFSYPNLPGDLQKWKTIKTALNSNLNLNAKIPGQNDNDQIDNKMFYACLKSDQFNSENDAQTKLRIPNTNNCYDKFNISKVAKEDSLEGIHYVPNTNYHGYQQPTLFLGMVQKNFNLYTQQSYNHSPDSITREFDNEWDFVMSQDHDGQVSVRGLTMAFSGGGHPLAKGSYMLRMAGFNHMPLGLKIDGIWPYGGKNIVTDSGFFVFKWTMLNNSYLAKINDVMSMTGLGQAKTNQGAYQLMSYMSKDGGQNNSLHFGLTRQPSTDPLQNLAGNQSPTCNNDGKCFVLGQVIFDPLGYIGGIALGAGQGENTKLGLIVDKDNNVIVNNKFMVNGKSVNDVVDNALVKSQINVVNGVAGLNGNKEVTANTFNNSVKTDYLQLNKYNDRLRFITNHPDTNNNMIDMFYNRDVGNKDDLGNPLDYNTFYFTNNKWGNKYKFNGDVATTGKITAGSNLIVTNRIETPNLRLTLSTPSSSSAACTAGDIKDDTNYHYVCVTTNKWKRVALSDF